MDREATPLSPETGGEPIPAGFALAEVEAFTEQRRSLLLAQLAGAHQPAAAGADLVASVRPAWARELDEIDIAVAEGRLSPRDAVLRRYWHWCAFWREWQTGMQPAAAADQRVAQMELLARVPVVVRLQTGREVPVTNRSYAAATHIAAHWTRIRILHEEMAADARDLAELIIELRVTTGRRARGVLRDRIRQVESDNQRRYNEAFYQRARLYAHVFTPDGAPAREPPDPRASAHVGTRWARARRRMRHLAVLLRLRSAEQARPWWETGDPPPWWLEITPADDAALLAALAEAGPERAARLGNPPPRPGPTGTPPEDLGWEAVLAWVETNMQMPPASLRDRDTYQVRTWLRSSAGAEPQYQQPGE